MRSPLASPAWTAALLLVAALAPAQEATLPPAPVPVTPPISPPGNTARPPYLAPAAPPAPLAYTPPPPAPVFPADPDPGPNGWGPFGALSSPEGWFFDAEIAVVFPAIKFRITNDMPLPLTGEHLQVPSVPLGTTVMPTFELGYRLGDSCGYFALAYSFLFADGDGRRDTLFGPAAVRTRLDINWVDLDYGTEPFEFWPRWEVSWRIGVRILDVAFDSRAASAAVVQTASNDFFGGGPHARFDLERRIVPLPGLALFGRVDGAAILGEVDQDFTLEVPGLIDSISARRTQLVPYLGLQAGLSYAPPMLPGLKFTSGYLFEDYFNVGRLGIDGTGEVSQSRGEVWSHGWFLRGRYDF